MRIESDITKDDTVSEFINIQQNRSFYYGVLGSLQRKCYQGSHLAIFCALALLLIAFMGISIYTGLQVFLESDLQRATMNAAMVGSSAYYSKVGAGGKPTPDPANAESLARDTFFGIASNSSLGGFGATTMSVTHNDGNDSITVNTKASLGTALLAPIGISALEVNAKATARALKYEPTAFLAPIKINPVSTDIGSYSRIINLTYPLVDGPGTDLYVEQDAADQQGYVLEACTATKCYNLASGATKVGTSPGVLTRNGVDAIFGSATIDLKKAGVNKASQLRITHNNDFNSGYFQNGSPVDYDAAAPKPLTLKRIMLFGYAGACAEETKCAIPAGYSAVE